MTKELPNPLVAAADTLPPLPNELIEAIRDYSLAPAFRRLTEAKEEIQRYALQAADKREAEVRTEAMRWREAIINELIIAHIYSKEHDDNPRKAIQDAISWNCAVALDPAVSSDAQALVEKGRAGMEADNALAQQQRERAKSLIVKLWNKYPETRAFIEGHTGSWFVWGMDRDAAIASASAVEGKTSTEVRALTPLLETKE